jgi:hypothetical protein
MCLPLQFMCVIGTENGFNNQIKLTVIGNVVCLELDVFFPDMRQIRYNNTPK